MSAPSSRSKTVLPQPGAVLTVLLLLLSIEGIAVFGILSQWPVLGEYYEGYSGLVTQLALLVSCASLFLWYWINRASSPPAPLVGVPRPRIPIGLVWFVLTVNATATLTFGYGAVGYAGTLPFAFLLTTIPLEPLLFARVAQRGRVETAPFVAYAALGLLRGWTGHLFFIFVAYLLTSPPKTRRMALMAAAVSAILVFEPLMEFRALIRGFDDSSGLLVHRLASRMAFTPISDYTLNNIIPVTLCGGGSYMPWYQELLFSVVPRAIFGIQSSISVHSCLAVLASGDPATELSFSTTLPIKAALILAEGIGTFMAFVLTVSTIIYLQVKLAKRLLGPCWYVYTSIYLYQFFLSGVMRDLAIPTYLLFVLFLIQCARTRRRKPRRPPAAPVDLPASHEGALP